MSNFSFRAIHKQIKRLYNEDNKLYKNRLDKNDIVRLDALRRNITDEYIRGNLSKLLGNF